MTVGAFHLEKKSENFGENFREFLYGKKLFQFFRLCVGVRCLKGHRNGGKVDINVR